MQFIGMKQTSAMFDRGEYTGFFTGSYATSGDYVQPGGIHVGNANDFINWYKAKLNGSQQERVMASFVIRTMMGARSGSPGERSGVPGDLLNRWEERVRKYANKGLIDFNANYSFDRNTFYQESSADIAWYYSPDQLPSIVFKHPSGKRYAIKRSCANPVGQIAPLEDPEPSWELKKPISQVKKAGGGWTNHVYAQPGEEVRFRHEIGNKGPDTAEGVQTRREYNNGNPSDWTNQSTLGAGNDRYVGSGDNGSPRTVPRDAKDGAQICEIQVVRPPRYQGVGVLRSDGACVTVRIAGQCEPGSSRCPVDFELEASCQDGIHITNLRQPPPNQDRNVAFRVRVYPNYPSPPGNPSSVVIDQNGNIITDNPGEYVIRDRGDVRIPFPRNYGEPSHIKWRVDVRAFGLGNANQNQYSKLVSDYIVDPSPCIATWDLYPSTDPVPSFIEQGGAVGFRHFVNNTGQKTSDGVNTCVMTNYSVYNPNGGNTGDHCSTSQGGVNFGSGVTGPMLNNSPGLYTDGGTPLGAIYCQRYRVDPAAPGGGGRESSNACTKIVGGKTYLSVQPASVDKIEPGKLGQVTANTITSQFADAPPGYTGYDIGCIYNVVAYLPYGGTQTKVPNTSCSHTIGKNGSSGNVVDYSYRPTPAEIGSKICVSVSIWSANGNGNLLAAGYSTSGTSCFDVIAKPYMKVLGGDVSAGSCAGGNAIIAGWNKLSDKEGPTGNGNLGSGTRYAAFAQGIINSFASGQDLLRDAGYGYSATNLSFANTSTNTGSGNFGGYFSGTPCVLSYFGSKPSNPSEVSSWPGMGTASTTIEPKIYSLDSTSAPTALGGATIPANVSIRLYVDGDVILDGDIKANYAGAIDASQMPSFTLIVKGNIYIQPGVKELYGTYVAEGVGKGNVYTCSNGTNPIGTANYSVAPPAAFANPHTQCANQLTFTGAVVAQKVILGRTYGSLYQDTGATTGQAFASEVFKYNPLSWIYSVVGPTTTHNDTYESMTTLPPVL